MAVPDHIAVLCLLATEIFTSIKINSYIQYIVLSLNNFLLYNSDMSVVRF